MKVGKTRVAPQVWVLVLFAAILAFAVWRGFAPGDSSPTRVDPSPKSDPEQVASPTARASGLPWVVAPPSSAPEGGHPDRALASVACASETLNGLRDPGGDCTQELYALRGRFERQIERLQAQGIRLDPDQCVATDKSGQSTRLDGMGSELAQLSKLVVQRGLSFSFEKDYGELPFKRAHLVALCSMKKSMDYWAAHPDQIPPADRIEDYLFFDVERGKPQESHLTGVFVRSMALLAQWRRERDE